MKETKKDLQEAIFFAIVIFAFVLMGHGIQVFANMLNLGWILG